MLEFRPHPVYIFEILQEKYALSLFIHIRI